MTERVQGLLRRLEIDVRLEKHLLRVEVVLFRKDLSLPELLLRVVVYLCKFAAPARAEVGRPRLREFAAGENRQYLSGLHLVANADSDLADDARHRRDNVREPVPVHTHLSEKPRAHVDVARPCNSEGDARVGQVTFGQNEPGFLRLITVVVTRVRVDLFGLVVVVAVIVIRVSVDLFDLVLAVAVVVTRVRVDLFGLMVAIAVVVTRVRVDLFGLAAMLAGTICATANSRERQEQCKTQQDCCSDPWINGSLHVLSLLHLHALPRMENPDAERSARTRPHGARVLFTELTCSVLEMDQCGSESEYNETACVWSFWNECGRTTSRGIRPAHSGVAEYVHRVGGLVGRA